jgi:hypothetical protein
MNPLIRLLRLYVAHILVRISIWIGELGVRLRNGPPVRLFLVGIVS